MKKLFFTATILFCTSQLFCQVSLNKTVPTSNVELISHRGNSGEIYYSTATDFMTYQCGDFNPTNLGSSVNDITTYGSILQTVGNDTLSINYASAEYYYGVNNTITNGTNTHDMNTPVNAIASDITNIYALAEFGTQFNIMEINGSSSNPMGTNFNGPSSYDLADYSDLDYFELNGVSYISIIYPGPNNAPGGLALYDMSDNSFYQTEEFGATSVTVEGGVAYFSIGNEIYELTAINPHGINPQFKEVTSTVAYTIDAGQTINEFDFGSGDIAVAATDGVYSECTSTVGMDQQKIALEAINVFPNPSNGQFNITGIEAGTSITIVNSQGQLIYEQKNLNQKDLVLDLDIPNGLYFVKIQSNESIKTARLVINK